MNFVKLFTSLLDSTLWSEPLPTRIVWITILLKADREGNLHTSIPGLARAANVTREECDAALASFLAPDPDSASTDYDGRRLRAIDRGFHVLNYEKYNELKSAEDVREKARVRQARKRARDKGKIERGEWMEAEAGASTTDRVADALADAITPADYCARCLPEAAKGGGNCPKCPSHIEQHGTEDAAEVDPLKMDDATFAAHFMRTNQSNDAVTTLPPAPTPVAAPDCPPWDQSHCWEVTQALWESAPLAKDKKGVEDSVRGARNIFGGKINASNWPAFYRALVLAVDNRRKGKSYGFLWGFINHDDWQNVTPVKAAKRHVLRDIDGYPAE